MKQLINFNLIAFLFSLQVPIFEKIGQIYELRLMMDFSQSNRGYMFVRYTNPSDAQRAVRTLDNYEIKPKKFIGVVVSVDNRKLWINGIPKNKSADEIKVPFLPSHLPVVNVVKLFSRK